MKQVIGLGKWFFAVPFLIFGIFHFMSAGDMVANVNPPGGVGAVYFTGLALIAAAVSMFIGKYDRLATVLLAVMLLLFVLIIHIPGGAASMSSTLKDIALAGGALMYAGAYAKDHSVIG